MLLSSANDMDLNPQDKYGNTPLHAACEDGSVKVAKLLISAGANQYIENREKKTLSIFFLKSKHKHMHTY